MNVAPTRSAAPLATSWQMPNVRLPFFGNTQTPSDSATIGSGQPTRPPAKPAAPSPNDRSELQKAQAINQQTLAAITQVTTRARVLGHGEIHSILSLIDNTQARLTAMQSEATGDPQTLAYIKSTIQDMANARKTYGAMDSGDDKAVQDRQAISTQNDKDSSAALKDAVDKRAKAFQEADDNWLSAFRGGAPPQ